MKKRISYTPEFKAKIAITAIKETKTVAEISSEEKIDPKSIKE